MKFKGSPLKLYESFGFLSLLCLDACRSFMLESVRLQTLLGCFLRMSVCSECWEGLLRLLTWTLALIPPSSSPQILLSRDVLLRTGCGSVSRIFIQRLLFFQGRWIIDTPSLSQLTCYLCTWVGKDHRTKFKVQILV